MEITLMTSTLRAALMFAPKKDIRFYLVGVHVEFKSNHAAVVATDGKAMFCSCESTPESVLSGKSIIMQRDALERACKGADTIDITELCETHCNVTAVGKKGAVKHIIPLLNGRFPDWRRVLPKFENDAMGFEALDPKYMHTAQRCFREMGGALPPKFAYHKELGTSALAYHPEVNNTFVVIMPMRGMLPNISEVNHAMDWAKSE